uniref:Uncharacterized protein n=1 Tax=Brassica oleracea var. oleracea TaxID=109376 RepID=A0A0D3DZB3_BRAOL
MMDTNTSGDEARKPYTISSGNDGQRMNMIEHIGTKTAVQIRSHAQSLNDPDFSSATATPPSPTLTAPILCWNFVGKCGGTGIFEVPIRSAVHPNRPPSFEARPHPLKQSQIRRGGRRCDRGGAEMKEEEEMRRGEWDELEVMDGAETMNRQI